MVPMTLCSFIDARPPRRREATTEVCTTVSTSSPAMTLAITGLRMSARTKRTVTEVPTRRDHVDADDAVDLRVGGDRAREAATEVVRDPGDENDATHGFPRPLLVRWRRLPGPAHLPRRRRWTRVFFSSLRCFFFAMRLRRFLMTEPTKEPFEMVTGRGKPRRCRKCQS